MKYRFIAALALSVFITVSSETFADNFADEIDSYYDIHEQRVSYADEYREERMKLDSRRHAYYQPLHEAQEAYWAQAQGGFGTIDYDAGTYGNNVKDYSEYVTAPDEEFLDDDFGPTLLGPREDFFDNEIEFMN